MVPAERFLELLCSALDLTPGSISMSTRFREDLDWDSMMGFMVLGCIEQDMGAELPFDTFVECRTFQDVYDHLSTLLDAGKD
jgi:acyl carrier protein